MTEPLERSAEHAWRDLECFLRERGFLSPREVLRPDIDVRWELGIEGDDAAAFTPDFFRTFQIKEGDFAYDRYFGSEEFNPFFPLHSLLFAVFFRRYREEVRGQREASKLTPRTLQRAIELGVWDSERLTDLKDTPAAK
ncbi:DUF1493 family protein [Paraburkholderia sp. MMS20-SJTR3]|uniref:DUF1493 family protein n=1 Tax=Paraburkholderia sejongensis TaxID=2886946 RepID=A0ABS8JZK4_9BURK|nr:DUF1493 family protein [Paraburkholderia sp. MMS20-SJTR3]MCC8395143.1 DUF1493 family protein [Paraburkholderia sp. MMS20-SJTR3]